MRCAMLLLIASLTACGNVHIQPAVETFCTRVSRYHSSEAERAFLKANQGVLEGLIRWAGGINRQHDETCRVNSGAP